MADRRIDASWYVKPEGMDVHACAGGLVVRRDVERVLVAFCRQKGYDDYIIPKGHMEPGESIEEAARREIEEEAGFTQLVLLGELGVRERLDYRKRAWKRTHYFLFLTDEVAVHPTHVHHHPPPVWFALEDAPALFWPEQQELLDRWRERICQAVHAGGIQLSTSDSGATG